MNTHSGQQSSQGGTDPATRTIGIICAILGLIAVLTWAVSVFFGIALVKSLAGVILALFLIFIGLVVAGVT